MNTINCQVQHGFIYMRLGKSGVGFYVSQLEAFGEILFKSGAIVEFDPIASCLKCSETGTSTHIPLMTLPKQYCGIATQNHSISESSHQTTIRNGSQIVVAAEPDEIALADIEGLHRKVRLAMRKTSGLSRDLLPLSSDEVMDLLRVFPITLVKEQDKNTCVLGIYSYLLASSHIKNSKKVPVRWYTGKMGIPLQRLIMVELLTLPFVLGLKKRQYQTFLNYVKPTFDDLYKNSFFNSHHSEKHIATHLGIDERTLKKESFDA